MSTLQVENLIGPTSGSNANKVIIPSGQTLDASNGFVAPSGHVIQTIDHQSGDPVNSDSTTYIDTYVNVSITTTKANSKILYLGQLGINCSTARYGYIRIIKRISGSDVEIYAPGRISMAGNNSSGDVENTVVLNYLDEPNQPAGTTIEYRLQIRNAGVNLGGAIFRSNDNINSSVVIQEIAQ
jgi:hypothetical protein